ncbi:MAG TPA: VOC family protein [Devosia sp.]|jgi:PhnB protein|nr:VOC family protein [Devosia sp.]
MASRLNPYLSFTNNAREAMEYYKSVFGGELTMSTFGDGGMAQNPADKDKIMHAQLETPAGFTLMASDTPSGMDHKPGNTMSVSLSGDEEGPLKAYWDKLKEGGTIAMPLEKAPWGDHFGMLTDKFGTPWMVNIAGTR